MDKFITGLAAICILSLILHQFLGWWIFILVCAFTSFILNLSWKQTILMTFLGMVLLWGGAALLLDMKNDGLLSSQVGALFGNIPSFVLILITGLVAGIMGVLGGIVGKSARLMG